MKAMAAAAKAILSMFKDPARYKAAEFRWAADTIRDKSGVILSGHFASEAVSSQSKSRTNILEERDGSTASRTTCATTLSRWMPQQRKTPDRCPPVCA